MKKFPRPAELYTSNYFAVVDPEECAGCETCIDRCQMEALSMVDEVLKSRLGQVYWLWSLCDHLPIRRYPTPEKRKGNSTSKDTADLYQQIMMKKMGMA